MPMDAVLLARIQFAFTIAFHIIFPSFTIGLAMWIATLEGLWIATGRDHYHQLARFWTKIFAVSFAMGVVSGLVMSYQFGTNWSRFSRVIGNIVGPLLGYEVMTAFFLEATFLGIMLFGWKRVPRGIHFTASLMVAFGTLMSMFWILSANSWMQTPAGFEMHDGVVFPLDWVAIVFNPSFPYRLAHMAVASFLTVSFVVAAAGAGYRLAGRNPLQSRTMLHMGLGAAILLAPLQLLIGDMHGLNTRDHQPSKIAGLEAHWENDSPVPLVLFAIPDEKAETNHYELSVPYLGSLILDHSLTGRVPALKDFPPQDRPPVIPIFVSFRLMVGIGLVLILVALIGAVLWARGLLAERRWYLRILTFTWPLGFIAILAGWTTTEVGRQPWVAQGLLRTANAASPIPGSNVAVFLALFVLVYGIVFGSGAYYINRLIRKGPEEREVEEAEEFLPNRPISAAHDAGREALHEHGLTFSPRRGRDRS
jgi:cytochrome d ubiquinol oxidase subunit I